MKRKILIVDDALTMRKLVAFTLRGAGLDVVEAPDGVDALSTLARQSFDLIIPDVNMPRMDGIPLTRQARATPNGRSVPILILTTESEVSKKNEAAPPVPVPRVGLSNRFNKTSCSRSSLESYPVLYAPTQHEYRTPRAVPP